MTKTTRRAAELVPLLGLSKGTTKSEKDLIGFRWFLNGRTGLRNRPYKFHEARKQGGGGATGSYTMRRTWRNAKAVLQAQGKAGRHLHSYLLTHTMPAEYTNDERRTEWRRLIDTLRKKAPVSYAWVTETHTGGGQAVGRIHHHMVLSFRARWWYTKDAKRWSWAYCGSSNGVDIRPVRRGAAGYLAKYLCKGLFDCAPLLSEKAGDKPSYPTLPFRWWGCSNVPRTGIMYIEREAVDWCAFSTPWYNATYLWVPVPLATSWSAHEVLARVRDELLHLPPAG